MKRRQSMRRLLLLGAIIAAPLLAGASGALRGLDDAVVEWRMSLLPRSASGAIVHLAMDKASLDAIGVWPWPREIHARVIDALTAAGAVDIAFDIDFSAASDRASDQALADALARANGSVILPAFAQQTTADARSEIGFNLPLEQFRENAWIGSAGLRPDPDGVVRRFPYGAWIAGEQVPSVPALLAGTAGPPGAEFAINFALDPHSVPTFSIIDLLEGRIGSPELEGMRVLVGAHALELGDNFAVPVHGVISGPKLQILAAESLAQGIALASPRPGFTLLTGILFLAAALWPRARTLLLRLARLAAAGLVFELGAVLIQARYAIAVPSAGLHLAALAAAVLLLVEELDLRGWLERLARLRASNTEQVLKRIIEDSSDAIVILDEEGRVLEMSGCARALLASDETEGWPVPPAMLRDAAAAIGAIRDLREVGSVSGELSLTVGDRTRILEYTVTPSRLARLNRGRPEEDVFIACVTARDVTERRRHLDRLDYLSRFDEGTGALRRGEFLIRLEAALAVGVAEGRTLAVYVVDLRRFNAINLFFGRKVGDLVLAAIVGRLAACDARLSDVARLGGDAFAVFTRAAIEPAEVDSLAASLLACVAAPLEVAGTTARLGGRLGLTRLDPDAPGDATALLAEAEAALDEARHSAGAHIRSFDSAAGLRQERRRMLECELWGAIDRDELHLAYQPQVRLADGDLIGAEALVRWRHPELGAVSPVEFIEIAEENGFIERLGRWVLETACAEAVHWPDALSVAVNVSPVQLGRSDIIAEVTAALTAAGLAARRLQLEITESSFLAPTADFLELLGDLRMTGALLALDDFGSGFSSLGYISRFPLDKIKIDRMFVQRVGEDRANDAVLRSIARLAEDLEVRVVCEGVETEAQLAHLRRSCCHDGQGYLFGRPMPALEFRALIAGTRHALLDAKGTALRARF